MKIYPILISNIYFNNLSFLINNKHDKRCSNHHHINSFVFFCFFKADFGKIYFSGKIKMRKLLEKE